MEARKITVTVSNAFSSKKVGIRKITQGDQYEIHDFSSNPFCADLTVEL